MGDISTLNNLLTIKYDESTIMAINALILCVVFISTLYVCHSRHWPTKTGSPLFGIYLCSVLSMIGDIIWLFIDGNTNLIWLNYIVNYFSLGGCPLIGFFWLIYAIQFFPSDFFKQKYVKFIISIPMLFGVILILLSPIIKKMFYIDENGIYTRGPWYIFQSIWYGYMFVASGISIYSIKKVNLSVEKTHLKIIACATLPVLLIGCLQLIFPAGGLPYVQLSQFLSLFTLFVHDEESRITVDRLTKLKTRYEFEKILMDKMKKLSTDKQLYVIASDLNGFKAVNDNFGHSEGDVAICKVGDIMDQVAFGYKAIACRRSGDEFLIAVESTDKAIAIEITKSIDTELDKFNDTKKYSISLSYGIARYNGNETLIELLNRADALMYVEKRKYKAKHKNN